VVISHTQLNALVLYTTTQKIATWIVKPAYVAWHYELPSLTVVFDQGGTGKQDKGLNGQLSLFYTAHIQNNNYTANI